MLFFVVFMDLFYNFLSILLKFPITFTHFHILFTSVHIILIFRIKQLPNIPNIPLPQQHLIHFPNPQPPLHINLQHPKHQLNKHLILNFGCIRYNNYILFNKFLIILLDMMIICIFFWIVFKIIWER